MEYDEEHWSWSTCREQCVFTVFEIYSFLSKHPSLKVCSSSDLCISRLLSSTKSVPMCLVTCQKYKQSHIFISPCRNDPSQLQICRTKRFFTVFGTLRVTWRQRKEILSPTHLTHPAHPTTACVLSLFCKLLRFHSVWSVRHCTASTVVPKYGPHLVIHDFYVIFKAPGSPL